MDYGPEYQDEGSAEDFDTSLVAPCNSKAEETPYGIDIGRRVPQGDLLLMVEKVAF